jgi:hypothetical protein
VGVRLRIRVLFRVTVFGYLNEAIGSREKRKKKREVRSFFCDVNADSSRRSFFCDVNAP